MINRYSKAMVIVSGIFLFQNNADVNAKAEPSDQQKAKEKKKKDKRTKEVLERAKKCDKSNDKSKCLAEVLEKQNKGASDVFGLLGNLGSPKK